MKFKQEALRLDDTLRIKEEPYRLPGTPPGRMGLRWIVRNGAGEVVGMGDVGNPNSAWRRAWATLRYPEVKGVADEIARQTTRQICAPGASKTNQGEGEVSDPKDRLIDEFSAAKADREEKREVHLEARSLAQEADRAYSAACDRYDAALDAMVKAL